MAEPIVSRKQVLDIYDAARKSLDPDTAVEHTAGVTGLDAVAVWSVVQGREAAHTQAMECLG